MLRNVTMFALGFGVLFSVHCGEDSPNTTGSPASTTSTGAGGSATTSAASGSAGSSGAGGGASTTGGSGGTGGSAGSGGAVGAGGAATGAGGATGGSSGAGGATGGSSGAGGATGGSSGAGGSGGARDGGTGDGGGSKMSFFVTSTGSGAMGGNLGGLEAADMKCQMLAAAVGAGGKTWHAFLSVEMGPGGTPVNAKDRIGMGPWYDQRGRLIAQNLAGLFPGPNLRPMGEMAAVDDMIDENGVAVQKSPLQHDILTGTKADGTVATGLTCQNWTSNSGTNMAQLGHADMMGPADRHSWVESHTSQSCTQQGVAAGGGNGRIYCFATN